MLERVQEVFRDVFDDDQLVITPETDAGDIQGWDSLNHINLVVAFEEEFEISLSAQEAASVANVGALLDLLASKTG